MSMQRPPTAAERLAIRQSAGPSTLKQLIVLLLGVAGAATIAAILSSVSERTTPIWVVPVIASGVVCFAGLLATTAWSMRAATGQTARSRIGGGTYLTSLLLVGGVVASANDAPAWAVAVPLAAAAALALLTVLGVARRRRRAARLDTLRGGVKVAGTVTDNGLAEFPDTPDLKLATLTVTFRDTGGVQRWSTVRAVQSPRRPIVPGDTVDVWFDHLAPGDESRIVVEHDNGASRVVPGVRPGHGS